MSKADVVTLASRRVSFPGVDLSTVPFIVYDTDASSASESDYDDDGDFWKLT